MRKLAQIRMFDHLVFFQTCFLEDEGRKLGPSDLEVTMPESNVDGRCDAAFIGR